MQIDATVELLVLGGGKMGEALLGGLLANGMIPSEVVVIEPVAARRTELEGMFPGVLVLDGMESLTRDALGASGFRAKNALIAVKPHQVVGVCLELRGLLAESGRVLSIAAGITTRTIEGAIGSGFAVLRAMPNTPALVGKGVSGVAGGASASAADVAWAVDLLSAVGIARSFSEAQLDAVTGLSGSGPAYVFLIAEALTEAGVLVGLSRDDAATLTAQTLLGAATLLIESPTEAATLRANVTSPGGTTAAGLRALENRAVRAAFIDAVAAATARATELRGE